MAQLKWFNRKFDFSNNQNIFPLILERLKGTPVLLEYEISIISEQDLRLKPEGTWSILENIGHLIDLEPIWLGRLQDILQGDEIMRTIDLENTKTHLADHNLRNTKDLVKEFMEVRSVLTGHLEKLTNEEVFKSSLHPRLNTPMRIMDLFLFVAEHDDHHLATINQIVNSIKE